MQASPIAAAATLVVKVGSSLVTNEGRGLDAAAADARARGIVRALRWKAPWFLISAISGKGCRELSGRVFQFISTVEKKKARRAA